ncbi:hypothetical protein RUMHYD_03505 [Blautia hydrogenotrophica DSM 10507]|uniref:Uncharacterized protein n=1 Tax=Blautia hydrogenotrophica (strain DSM 10507 / JCM 14656 / S5a33) TaxID=476272 RepID=C0CRJ1_BLAHS|nr:hypothetical protein RUMHYD_03505 [Blautia hydrogenotrophica DSM 10507]
MLFGSFFVSGQGAAPSGCLTFICVVFFSLTVPLPMSAVQDGYS